MNTLFFEIRFRMRGLVLVLMLAMGVTEAVALNPERNLHEYLYRHWTSEDGMLQDSVTSVAQTSDGYLWIGTQAGLMRFNGLKFESFDPERTSGALGVSFIERLFEDAARRLWILAQQGLAKYEDGKFTTYSTANGLPDNDVTAVAEDADKRLYFGVRGFGMVVLEGDTFVPFRGNDILPSLSINDIAIGGDGVIWIGTDAGLVRIQAGRARVYTLEDGLPHLRVRRLLLDSQQKLWVGTEQGLCLIKDGRDCEQFDEQASAPIDHIKDLFEDSGGNIWCGTLGTGLFRYQRGRFGVVSDQVGLDMEIAAVAEDREGNLWVGTGGFGLFQIRDGKLYTFLPTPKEPTNPIWALLEDSLGRLWFATHKGLAMYDDGEYMLFGEADGLSSDRSQALANARDGGVWVANFGGGLSLFRDGRFFHLHDQSDWPLPRIRSLWEDKDGVLWVGTAGRGVLLVKNGKVIDAIDQEDGLPANRVSSIVPSQSGGMWLATKKGVVKYQGGRVHQPQKEGPLPAVFSLAPIEDAGGNLWFGTAASGLGLLKDGNFYFFDKKRGLPTNQIYAVIGDSGGSTWCLSDIGVIRLRTQQLLEAAAGATVKLEFEVFDTGDGMRHREGFGGNQPTVWRTRDDRLMFCTLEGAAVVTPGSIARNEIAPPVIIERVIADGKSVAPSSSLPPETRRLDIDFAGLSYISPDQVSYKYRLEPLETEWSEASFETRARYTTLDDSEYTFRVVVANADGVWNEEGASFSFTIEPYWYERPAFVFLVLLAVVGLVGVLVRARERTTEKRNRQLSELSWKRTREVLERQVGVIRTLISEASGVSDHLQTLMGSMSTSSKQVVAAVSETSQTVRQMEESSREAEQKATAIVEASDETRQVSLDGLAAIDQSIGMMLEIKDESATIANDSTQLIGGIDEIDTITAMVKAVSERSKILAINASIEAAKAGQAGSGFGVVASRMKELALQSRTSAQDINKLLEWFRRSTSGIAKSANSGRTKIEAGADAIGSSGDIVKLLSEKVENNAQLANVISESIVRQMMGFKHIVSSIDQISSAAAASNDMGKEISSSAARLDAAIEKLQSNINEWETPEFYQK